jgi:DNA polymerase-3 subunit delta'
MSSADSGPSVLLRQAVERERIHSAYLLSGPGPAPQEAAREFARALACVGDGTRPCEACLECRRSAAPNEIAIDGSGRSGPPYRQIGDHPDLLWVERGRGDTRVRITQIRAVQSALRLRTTTPGRRAVVIADAEWLNQEAQNALLRLLEEPPPRTTLVLVASTSAGLLATVRSRCQRIPFPAARPGLDATPDDAEADRSLGKRLDAILLETAQAWLRERVADTADADPGELRPWLDAFRTLSSCRKALVQRNANPQMVAERALFALREAAA